MVLATLSLREIKEERSLPKLASFATMIGKIAEIAGRIPSHHWQLPADSVSTDGGCGPHGHVRGHFVGVRFSGRGRLLW